MIKLTLEGDGEINGDTVTADHAPISQNIGKLAHIGMQLVISHFLRLGNFVLFPYQSNLREVEIKFSGTVYFVGTFFMVGFSLKSVETKRSISVKVERVRRNP